MATGIKTSWGEYEGGWRDGGDVVIGMKASWYLRVKSDNWVELVHGTCEVSLVLCGMTLPWYVE